MNPLFCGAARRCITPPRELLRDLRGLKQHKFAGVIDDLYVRAAVFQEGIHSALLIAFDMTMAPCTKEILKEISQKINISEAGIFFFSTHTHAVPFNIIDLECPGKQSRATIDASQAYTKFLHVRTLEAVLEAKKNMRPAKMGTASGESFINVFRIQDYNYTDKSGKCFTVANLGADFSRTPDRRLFAVRVTDMAGETILNLINYPMHNVATIWNDFDGTGSMGVSSDIGGNVSRLMEERYPGSVCIWSSGAAGDLNPIMTNEVILPDPVTGRTVETSPAGTEFAFNCLKIMTARHYQDVLRVFEKIDTFQSEADIRCACAWSVTPGVNCIRHIDAQPEFVMGPEVPEHTVLVQMARIGELTICGVGVELYSSIGRAMLEEIGSKAILITHNASTLCSSHYILDDETFARCDASRGYAMVPGYDEYRCQAGVMKDDLCRITRELVRKTER